MNPETRASRGPYPQGQFDRQARAYSASQVFREGETLELLARWASGRECRWGLDLGAGAGFTAFALAPYARRMVVTDPALGMLAEARRNAQERHLNSMAFAQVNAEDLPVRTGCLQLVACRMAAHHFTDPLRYLQESHRALGKGGLLLLADIMAPEELDIARWQDGVERRRDPSHVRDLPISEWQKLLTETGFHVEESLTTRVQLEFNDWVRRSGTPADEVERLRQDFQHATPEICEAFQIRFEGDKIPFSWPCLLLKAVNTGQEQLYLVPFPGGTR